MLFVAAAGVLAAQSALAAPYAAIVMDARTGETLYETNASTRLHPASLTKMMTLYITFQAIQRGEISLDSMVTVTKNAAAEPPSKLGLRAGQRIALRYLIRAAAVKSANDAATAICEAVGGSEAAFAERMNRTAKAIGMKGSTFRNCNGLTAEGHLSTARDMNLLGRRLFFDFPQYYNIFSRRTADAGVATVSNTNTRFLDAYKGADGIKTGYTSPAGYNLTASAQRGNKRIIATVFGGKSTAHRNAKMAELLDLGFREAPTGAKVRRPEPIDMNAVAVASAQAVAVEQPLQTVLTRSPRPLARPGSSAAIAAAAKVDTMQGGIESALAASLQDDVAMQVAQAVALEGEGSDSGLAPRERPAMRLAAASPSPVPTSPEVITRMSTSGGRHWGVNVGRFPSRSAAERQLMRIALAESGTLNDGLRKIMERSGGYDANFMGLTQEEADLACRRLQARAIQCFAIGP
ncbi:D-alanyl-D-alanine carboxypeptidase [Cereibacter sphaeroides]|uniref:D-alanyl-D-alanine carboxypeptidase family protein n=1 Tax=Rhodobacterales TaxID=204455 RepID=UPI0018E06DF8|nr:MULTISPECIES: D-alanyl-D-alanine carboxypeptidase family protein [Paracoccaceae]MCE6950538.1 D-alanyl-D-alanine carboxypeptidase [Cereibacter sphaeroides]MCE6959429.1 D-alanyl-D-alanine carboxypeptidase [Cereibacter sphaeroides]MCE6968298.1 D-alanyl-D-alanine carboxypeptidase [Cereibacter sphaeroides]MCE6973800.1 D-alanyl-D-alanine carboxypeptidase [Cereibacter sphaeroides]